ncbi:MAG: DNA/RNA nuclease SfsA [Deltaproteobacteria bacterium]|nr:MAG: DNA/RNA nuclease SfsA [Deltaproteobacteria bacterium]
MHFPQPLLPGVLIRLYQRFLAEVRLPDGSVITAHCPNSGSMKGCDHPGREVRLSPAENPKRKTRFTWEMIHLPSTWVGINTLNANRLLAEAATLGVVPEFGPFDRLTREVSLGDSRIDFGLVRDDTVFFVEVKNVTLVENGTALFPDAPTLRGRKHLRALMDAVRGGHRGAIFYVIQRQDAVRFAPASAIDPLYAQTLRQARDAGVEMIAYRARVNPEEIALEVALPVELETNR